MNKMDKDMVRYLESEITLLTHSRQELAKLKEGVSTYTPALYIIKRIQNLEAVVGSIEAVYNRLPDYKKKLVELRYWATPCLYTWDGIAIQCHISRRQIFIWRDEFIRDVALELGLLRDLHKGGAHNA